MIAYLESLLGPYAVPIVTAIALFPIVAALITLPYAVHHYRKFGGLPVLRCIIVYSFVFYLMCAVFLTMLPLPDREVVAAMPRIGINWIPFRNLYEGLCDFGFDPDNLTTLLSWHLWTAYLTSMEFFQLVANVVMLMPLGFYLRYYFKCGWKKTVFMGFCLSLIIELIQLSGLFGIYSQPYRCPDVGDLMSNTFGALLGYWCTKPLLKVLPTRERIDQIAWSKGKSVTVMRRVVAETCDWIIVGVASMVLTSLGLIFWVPAFAFFYFVVLQWACKGLTLGKILLRIKMVQLEHCELRPTFWQMLRRYLLIYIVFPCIVITCLSSIAFAVGLCVGAGALWECIVSVALSIAIVAFSVWFTLHSFRRTGVFPESAYSHTTVIPVKRAS